MGGRGIHKDDGAEEGDDEEGEGECEDEHSLFPGGHVEVLFVLLGRLGAARKEDQEEQHAGGLSAKQRQRDDDSEPLHEEETRPLHADLRDAEQGRCAGKRADLVAARHVSRALGQGQDVGDAGSA